MRLFIIPSKNEFRRQLYFETTVLMSSMYQHLKLNVEKSINR